MTDTKTHLIWAIAILLVVIILCGFILALARDYQLTQREAIKAGLVEKPNVGERGYHWEKQ